MRKVELRMNEQKKYEVIKELVDHNGNKNRASEKLGISRRQIDRLIIKYKEKGKSGFVHGNHGHISPKTLAKSISENIILLYMNKYYDFNFIHFKKFLEKKEKKKYIPPMTHPWKLDSFKKQMQKAHYQHQYA